MKHDQSILLVICMLGTAVACASEPVTTDLIKQRGVISMEDSARLIGVMRKAQRGEEITIAAIGGSITAGGVATKNPENRYVARVAAWFTRTFPNAKVRFVNAGIGATNSVYGAMRVQADVLAKKPDLVMVEWAVNNKPGTVYSESSEGLFRQILRDPRQIAVIQLFFMHRDGTSEQQWLEILGRHYRLPMASFRDAWWPEIVTGRVEWDYMYVDVVHPNDTGHILASELLSAVLENANRKSKETGNAPAVSLDLPAPMISNLYADCVFSQYDALKPVANNGWTRSARRQWESPAADSSIEFEFTGPSLFLGFDIEKGAEPLVTFSIDGGAPQPLKPDGNRPPIATGLTPTAHRVRVEYSGSKAPQAAVGQIKIWAIGAPVGKP